MFKYLSPSLNRVREARLFAAPTFAKATARQVRVIPRAGDGGDPADKPSKVPWNNYKRDGSDKTGNRDVE